MMDKQLVAMCDTPEIQEEWQPKVGDSVYEVSVEKVKYIADMSSITTYDSDDMCIHLNCEDGYYNLSYSDTAHIIYIPHMEDVLEWLGDKFDYLRLDATTGNWRVAVMAIAEVANGYTPTQALLKAYMNLSHNKTWDGKTWSEVSQ